MRAETGSQWRSQRRGVTYEIWVVQTGDDQCLGQAFHCIFYEERLDPADVVEDKSTGSGHSCDVGGAGQSVIEVQPRFLTVNEGETVTSSTVTDRSMWGKSFPAMKSSSVLLKVSLRRWAVVQAEMSARHSKMHIATWSLEDGGKERNSWVSSAQQW